MKILGKIITTLGYLCVAISGFFIFITIFGDFIKPYDPNFQDLAIANQSFSSAHWLGTDHLGRDTLSRLISGAQTTMIGVSIILTLAAGSGLVVGTISGYFGGWLDEGIMRIVDFGLSVPSFIVALAIVGVFGPSYQNMILALALAYFPIYARLARGAVASAVNQPHIESLWVLGASRARIIIKHLMPAAFSSVLVYASADAGALALAIANLSFLGLGVQPPQSEWGQMLVSALPYLEESPRQVMLPGLALTAMVIGFNLFGEAVALAKTPKKMGAKDLAKRRNEYTKREVLA